MGEMHKLFEQRIDEEEEPDFEEIGVINVARLIGTRKIPDTKSYRPDELPDLHAVGSLFGAGEYVLVARRAHTGPNGEKPGSIYRRNHGVIIGAEYGPWKRMLDGPPKPDANAPAQNGAAAFPAQSIPMPGVPDASVMSHPFMMMMWMQHQQAERDRAARQEQIERDRISSEQREGEARRQHELTLAMLQQQGQRDPGGGALAGLPSMFASFAETLAKVQHPAPAPVVAAPTGVSQAIADFKNLAEAAKLVKGNEDVELVKAIGQGLSGLAGLGSLMGGGLTGAPT